MSIVDLLTMGIMAIAIAMAIVGHFYATEASIAAGLMIVAPTDELKLIALAFMAGIVIADWATTRAKVIHLHDISDYGNDEEVEKLLRELRKELQDLEKENKDDEQK